MQTYTITATVTWAERKRRSHETRVAARSAIEAAERIRQMFVEHKLTPKQSFARTLTIEDAPGCPQLRKPMRHPSDQYDQDVIDAEALETIREILRQYDQDRCTPEDTIELVRHAVEDSGRQTIADEDATPSLADTQPLPNWAAASKETGSADE